MIKAKKWLLASLGFALFCMALHGCGGSDSAKPPGDPSLTPANEQDLPIMKNLPEARGDKPKAKKK